MTATATSIYDAIHAVDLGSVPVMTTDRCIGRKNQAALARQLFKRLGVKKVSVTAPNYSMAQTVDVRLPCEPHPGFQGFEQYEHATYSDMPDFVPAKAALIRRRAAIGKVEAILARAFPNHDDRSKHVEDYFDYCWSVS